MEVSLTRWLPLLSLTLPAVALARPLTLDEALALAVAHHPQAAESAILRDQAEAAVLAARGGFDPTLTASVGTNSRRSKGFIAGYPTSATTSGWDTSVGLEGALPTGTTWSASTSSTRSVSTTDANLGSGETTNDQATWSAAVDLSVRQDLLIWMRRDTNAISVRTATERLASAEMDVLVTTESAIAEVADGWWTLWSTTEQLSTAKATVDQASALEASTRAQHDEGQVAMVEVDRTTAERLAAESTALEARVARDDAADALALLLGLEPGTPLEATGPERLTLSGPTAADAVLADALEGNLELARLRLLQEASAEAVADARGQRLPELDLVAGTGVATLTDDAASMYGDLATSDNQPYGTLGVELRVPLGGRASRAALRDATLEDSLRAQRVDVQMRSVKAEVLAAIRQESAARTAVELADARLRVARSTEEGERARMDEGLLRLDELLDAVRSRREAEAAVITARVALARAELERSRLQGRLVGEVLDVR